jgi:chaperonin cofactor prefoldin
MSDEQQAFNELRMKQNELQKQLMQVSSQQGMKERQKRKSELTTAELAELPAGTNLYRSVGKTCAFLASIENFSPHQILCHYRRFE